MTGVTAPSRVERPWGHELPFAQTDRYAGTLLHLRAGGRIDLRYHKRRDVTAYLLSGRLLLTQGRSLDAFDTWEVEPGGSWRTEPGVVHSIEALADAVVLEVSSPEREDAVRLSEVYGRVVTD